MEDVQRRATKTLSHLRDKPYPERLRSLKLPCLEHRRRRGCMIETYKFLHGHYNTTKPEFVKAQTNQLRGNSLKLHKERNSSRLRANYFANRVINDWNNLPDNVVTAPSMDSFKKRLDQHWKSLPTIYEPTCQS